MTLRYFAYGSNLHPVRLKERTPSCRLISVAKLFEHRLCFHKKSRDGSAKANAFYTGRPADHVMGVIYEMDGSDKGLLDEFEGLGNGYLDKKTIVENNTGSQTVFTYVAEENYISDSLNPFIWYKELVLRGARFHQFPEDYINQIVEVDPIQDPDDKRNQKNRYLLEKMGTKKQIL
ncbi:MAG: hypothetical protein NPINA01_26730 [Nitrospinaceae bacterium]|nr:MAG: hypothetical protein NPINA01_26730 [Nitrospinaceae bacterium]